MVYQQQEQLLVICLQNGRTVAEDAYQIFGLGYLPFKGFLPLQLPQPPPVRFQLCLNLVLSLDKNGRAYAAFG